ncbi:MAG: FAD/NAD(P)-binding protein [Syntrophobacteraceae bacterium]
MTDDAPLRSLDAMLPDLYRVRRVVRETADTFTLRLLRADGKLTPCFEPGQFNMLYGFGIGEVPISISGDPSENDALTHTVRAVGSVTRAICAMKQGDTIGVRGPFGRGWPVIEAQGHDVVLAAGGLGMAPLRPAVLHLLAHRDDYGRVALVYGARSPDDLLFRNELEKWRGRLDADVAVTVDSAPSGWHGNVGVVTNLLSKAHFDPERTTAMVCGPEVMMRFATMELLRHDVSAERVFVSMERNMKCGVGLCGHCQFGPFVVCREGPVFPLSRVQSWLGRREV